MAQASLSVDLDSLGHYCRIHGLPESLLDARQRALVHGAAVERFGELFSALGRKATLFVIGAELETEGARRALKAAHEAGLELGNHSLSHDYALSRRAPEVITTEVEEAARRLLALTGERPKGFRAPGYTLSAQLLRVLEAQGYLYDSSAFPAAPYWLAKAAVMGGMRLFGRRSEAILDSPRVLRAPRVPYHPSADAPYEKGEMRLLELPIAVEARTRMPFIGTFLVTLPEPLVRVAYRSLRQERFLNVELHAVDLLGREDGLPEALVARQRDLGIRVEVKRRRLERLFRRIADDFEVVTLSTAASRLTRQGPM